MPARPDTVTDTVNAADGTKRATAHAARVYRQKYRQIALEEITEKRVEITAKLMLFNGLQIEFSPIYNAARIIHPAQQAIDLKDNPVATLLPLDRQSGGSSLVGTAFPRGHGASIPSTIPKITLGS
jgi:hypothetical protein